MMVMMMIMIMIMTVMDNKQYGRDRRVIAFPYPTDYSTYYHMDAPCR